MKYTMHVPRSHNFIISLLALPQACRAIDKHHFLFAKTYLLKMPFSLY